MAVGALIAEIVSWALLSAGALLCVAGALGMLRFPDVYARAHGAGVVDTGGAGLILIGLMVQGGFSLVTVKLAIILFFLFFTSPTATHAVVRAAMTGRQTPWTREGKDGAGNDGSGDDRPGNDGPGNDGPGKDGPGK